MVHGTLESFRTACDYPTTKYGRGSGCVVPRSGQTPNEILNTISESAPRDQALAVIKVLAIQRCVSDDPYVNGTITEPLLLFKDSSTLEVTLYRPPLMTLEESEMKCEHLEARRSEPCGTDKDGSSSIFGDSPNTYGMMLFSGVAKQRPYVYSRLLQERRLTPGKAAALGVAAPVKFIYYQEAFTIFVHSIPRSRGKMC